MTEENNHEETPEEIKAKVKSVGVIACGFHFLENPRRNRCFLSSRKRMGVLPPVSEKDVKGEALSHQTTYVFDKPDLQ
jgi:hypothetical protein